MRAERVRQAHLAEALLDVAAMQRAHPAEMLVQGFDQALGQHRDAVARAFAVAHYDLPVGEIHVLYAQRQALDLPQPRAVEQARHQPRRAPRAGEQAPDFGLAQHRRDAHRTLRADQIAEPGELDPEHRAVEKDER